MNAYIVERSAVEHNADAVLRAAGSAAVWAVLKGNGYGLGLIPMAALCFGRGVRRFAVTDPAEAQALRAGFPGAQILMLRPLSDRREAEALCALNVTFTVGSADSAALLRVLAQERRLRLSVHIKLDTGMGRYGFLPDELAGIEALFRFRDRLDIRGIYTHFYAPLSPAAAGRQFCRFTDVCRRLAADGFDPGERHCCGTTALFRYPEMRLDGVRVGSGFLGRAAFGGSGLTPVGYAETCVASVRELPKGSTLGYGGSVRLRRDTRVAVLPVGYYHGFGARRAPDDSVPAQRLREGAKLLFGLSRERAASGVSIGGVSLPVLGLPGMTHTCADATGFVCAPGDRARMEINPLMLKGMDIVYR